MATVTGLTAERMIEMENATVVDGNVVGNNLILVTRDGTQINAGNVQGPQGVPGPTFVVCTSTTRPSYSAGDEGKAIYETDTKIIRVWTGARFRMQEKFVCTSTTRPAMGAADEGVTIYETDSNSEYVWSGSAWIPAASSVFPIGFEMIWPGQLSSIPSGFIHEDGRVLVRASYPILFGVLGTSWNTGGESGSYFRIPDSRNRAVVGAGGSYGLGSYGGSATHTLTIAEMPNHDHLSSGAGVVVAPGANPTFTIATGGGSLLGATISGAYNTGFRGGNGAHNNMQPYASKFVIIRAL